jgi:hypothetical protein
MQDGTAIRGLAPKRFCLFSSAGFRPDEGISTDRRTLTAKVGRHPAGRGEVLVGEDDRHLARVLGSRHIGGRRRSRGIGGRCGRNLTTECCADRRYLGDRIMFPPLPMFES